MSKVWISAALATTLLVTAGITTGVIAQQHRLYVSPAPEHHTPELGVVGVRGDVDVPSDSTALRATLDELLRNPDLGKVGAYIHNTSTGETLNEQDADTPMLPASATKTLTAAAALLALAPNDRITTPVYQENGVLVIRASGDVWLDDARLDALAADIQGAMGEQEITAVQVDTAAWKAPQFQAGWDTEDIGAGYIAPMQPIMLHGGRIGGSEGDLPRSTTPALDVAGALAQRLGVEAVSEIQTGQDAYAGQTPIASTVSPALHERLRLMMEHSDNVMAEAIGREIDPINPAAATLRLLSEHGFDLTGVTLSDNSGLSLDNRIPARLFGLLMDAAVTGTELRPLLATLPVAGATGTLETRYPEAGRGWVRAKTGTLDGTTALVGAVPGASGQIYSFALISNDSDVLAARAAVDAIAATLRDLG